MSDCSVPMSVYSKDIIKNEEKNEDIPPIPDGWMAVSVPDACLTIENAIFYGVSTIRIDGLKIETVVPREQPFELNSKAVDVLVLVRKH